MKQITLSFVLFFLSCQTTVPEEKNGPCLTLVIEHLRETGTHYTPENGHKITGVHCDTKEITFTLQRNGQREEIVFSLK